MNLRLLKSANRFYTHTANTQAIQLANIVSQGLEASEEKINRGRVSADEPIVAEQILDGVVDRLMSFRFADIECGPGKHARAVALEFGRQLAGGMVWRD